MPVVSIVLPTFNRQDIIGRSIVSILSQTYQDFNLIIVDDGSTDDTESIVNSFNSKRIRLIQHEKKKGVAAARNTGLRLADGQYIAFQDSDDEWMPDKLEKQIKAFNTSLPEVGMVYTGSYITKDSKKKYIPPFIPQKTDRSILSNIVRMHFVTTSVLMIRRECFNKYGMFDEQLPIYEDWELFIRMSKHVKFVSIDDPLVLRCYQLDNISSNVTLVTQGFNLLFEKYYQDIKQDKVLLSKCYFKLGHLFSTKGNLSKGRDSFIKSIETHPLNIIAFISFIISLFGRSVYNSVYKCYKSILERS